MVAKKAIMGKKLSEHDIQGQIVQYLRLKGYLVFNMDVMSALGYVTGGKRFGFINHYKKVGWMKGQPDLVVVCKDEVIFIEVKTEKGKQSPEQKIVQAKIENFAIKYIILRSLDDAEKIF